MMVKLKDKLDADKKKLTAIFEAKIEDNREKFKIHEILSSHRGKGMSRKNGGQEGDWPRRKQYQNRNQTG
jgi:hypothetical protein